MSILVKVTIFDGRQGYWSFETGKSKNSSNKLDKIWFNGFRGDIESRYFHA